MQASFLVTQGMRTFTWTYLVLRSVTTENGSEESSMSNDSGTAWIDDIVFPVVLD